MTAKYSALLLDCQAKFTNLRTLSNCSMKTMKLKISKLSHQAASIPIHIAHKTYQTEPHKQTRNQLDRRFSLLSLLCYCCRKFLVLFFDPDLPLHFTSSFYVFHRRDMHLPEWNEIYTIYYDSIACRHNGKLFLFSVLFKFINIIDFLQWSCNSEFKFLFMVGFLRFSEMLEKHQL